jgi:hypothetical protein
MAKHITAKMPAEAILRKPAAEKPGPKRSRMKAVVAIAATIMATTAWRDCSTDRELSMVYSL